MRKSAAYAILIISRSLFAAVLLYTFVHIAGYRDALIIAGIAAACGLVAWAHREVDRG